MLQQNTAIAGMLTIHASVGTLGETLVAAARGDMPRAWITGLLCLGMTLCGAWLTYNLFTLVLRAIEDEP